jgi:hypothetical protein
VAGFVPTRKAWKQFMRLRGIIDDGPTDLSRNFRKYLYGEKK